MPGSDHGVTFIQQGRQRIFREHEEGPWRKRGSSGISRSQLDRRELCGRAGSLGKRLEEGEGWLTGDPLGKVYTERA